MALSNITDIGTNKTLTPNSELPRINYTVANRRLFTGNFVELQIPALDSATRALVFNWFRKAATFYPEFMFAQWPVITTGNERADEEVRRLAITLLPEMQAANVDMLRYGQGVLATHPTDPTQFVAYERDMHYEVVNRQGEVWADILVDVTGEPTDENRLVNVVVYDYRENGESTWRQFNYDSGNLGPQIASYEIPQRSTARQVILLAPNRGKTSIFDDIKDPITQVARIATATARVLKRNSNPHLYGPDTMLQQDENGKTTISENGMFLPMQQGDQIPGYLQWDSKVETAQWSHDVCMNTLFAMTGLSPVLFDPGIQTGTLTGVALRRTMLPFVSRLDNYARVNDRAVERALLTWNANRQVAGGEVYSLNAADINVEWTYESVFQDTEDTADGGDGVGVAGNSGGPGTAGDG